MRNRLTIPKKQKYMTKENKKRTMGSGDKSIDVATLRKLLPLWMRRDHFDVVFSFGENKSAEDCMLVSAEAERVRMYLSDMLRLVTIVDGVVAYKESGIAGAVLIRVWEGEE